jgi:hypothetical protein
MSDDITIAVSEEEKSFEEFQEQVQNEIAEIPDGGTYEIVSDSLVTFNRKTIEAFAKRSDVSISIIYTLNGKKYKVVIPAGYNMMDLLDENGYCGCLYLNMLFGSELAE